MMTEDSDNKRMFRKVWINDIPSAKNDPEIQRIVIELGEELAPTGRFMIRWPSAEPFLRIVVDAPEGSMCEDAMDRFYAVLRDRGYLGKEKEAEADVDPNVDLYDNMIYLVTDELRRAAGASWRDENNELVASLTVLPKPGDEILLRRLKKDGDDSSVLVGRRHDSDDSWELIGMIEDQYVERLLAIGDRESPGMPFIRMYPMGKRTGGKKK